MSVSTNLKVFKQIVFLLHAHFKNKSGVMKFVGPGERAYGPTDLRANRLVTPLNLEQVRESRADRENCMIVSHLGENCYILIF